LGRFILCINFEIVILNPSASVSIRLPAKLGLYLFFRTKNCRIDSAGLMHG
jgi:hypothetical protein